MSSSVDNRVVQMEFDNASFERGVAQTMRSLEKLDASLNFEKTGAGLSKLTSALDTVTFGGFSTTLDGLKEKATEVFSGITNAATNVAKVVTLTGVGLLGAAVTAATVGGTKRAANIEQARFQIQGLGMDYEALSKDIDYAVNGTAFGFDEAAKAAAQFGASGVQAGADMKMALRGISGVAAMTNSSYDEIFLAQKEVILELAKKPCIMVGRCSNIILREAGVKSFDIFLHADRAFRRAHALELNEYGKMDVDRYIDRCDHWRKTYYRAYTGHDMGDYHDYDLTIDVGKIRPEKVVELVVGLVGDMKEA